MRLYISSYRLGNHSDELLKLLKGGTKVALIANAVDFRSPEEIQERNIKDKEELTALGLDVTEIDLKKYFGQKEELRVELEKYELIWVRGGNAFVLRRAFKCSGADEIIKQLLEEDKLVYGGYSAGVCVLAPSLRGIEIVDDPNVIPEGYQTEIIWNGLDVLPYSIVPHYQSNHPESAEIGKTVQFMIDSRIPHKTLRDGEVLIIRGDHETLFA